MIPAAVMSKKNGGGAYLNNTYSGTKLLNSLMIF